MAGPRQGHMPAPETGIKPLHTPAEPASLHLLSSTRELSWVCPLLASLFPGLSSETRFSFPLDHGASCTGRRCYL